MNEKIIWDYLIKLIGNEYGAAGMMGNLYAESHLNPQNLQNTSNKKFNITDEQYTQLVDNNVYMNFVRDSAGYGLAQWTTAGRKQALLVFANTYKGGQKVSIGNLNMQLDFLAKELKTSYKSTLAGLQSATSVLEASNIVLKKFERPRDQSEGVQKTRASYGMNFYNKYATGKKANGSNAGNVVLAFQIAANKTGVVDSNGNKLEEDGKYGPNTDYVAKTIRLARGTRGSLVEWLQAFLRIDTDGKFGPATESSVNAYKKAVGLPENGVCDYMMIKRMMGK